MITSKTENLGPGHWRDEGGEHYCPPTPGVPVCAEPGRCLEGMLDALPPGFRWLGDAVSDCKANQANRDKCASWAATLATATGAAPLMEILRDYCLDNLCSQGAALPPAPVTLYPWGVADVGTYYLQVALNKRLAADGYYPIPENGVLDADTCGAVQLYGGTLPTCQSSMVPQKAPGPYAPASSPPLSPLPPPGTPPKTAGAPSSSSSGSWWFWPTVILVGVGGFVLLSGAAGVAAIGAVGGLGPEVTDKRRVTDPYGEPITVGKIRGEWYYYYDGEWTPLKYYGGPGVNARVVGDRLVHG